MSPTIVLKHRRPVMALGAAGGATIITTVLQTLINRIDLHMGLPAAIAAPRASQRNSTSTQAEPAFIAEPTTAGLEQLGQTFSISDTSPLDPSITIAPTIGVESGLQLFPGGRMEAAAEPVRRGGGSAGVVKPSH
jgi:gamma-glutamyltranspeptidase/glutathione hydrolase